MTALMLKLPGDYPLNAKMLIGYENEKLTLTTPGALAVVYQGIVPNSDKLLVTCPDDTDIIIRIRKAGIVPLEMTVRVVGEYMEVDLPHAVKDDFYGDTDT